MDGPPDQGVSEVVVLFVIALMLLVMTGAAVGGLPARLGMAAQWATLWKIGIPELVGLLLRMGLELAGGAVQLLEGALSGQPTAAQHAVEDDLACSGVDRQRSKDGHRQRDERPQREHRDEEQIRRGGHGADAGQQ